MIGRFLNNVLTLVISLILFTCSSSEIATRNHPSIDTNDVTDINSGGATFNAEILGLGTGVKDYGFVYGQFTNPSIDNGDRISFGETLKKGKISALANRNLTKDGLYYVKAYAIPKANGPVVYGQPVNFISKGATAPTITSFTPKEGSVGDTLIVIGVGFSNLVLSNSITLGAGKTFVPVFKSTQDSLWSVIPGTVIAGDNELTVKVGQLEATAKDKFKVKVMSITSFSPKEVSFSDTVTVEGLNFPILKNLLTATLFGVSADIISVTPERLKIRVTNSPTLTASFITLKSGTQNVSSAMTATLVPPVINSFLPTKGTKDTEIILTGKYFNPIVANNKVQLNGKDILVVEATRKTLKVKLPTGIAGGSYPFSVTIANQTTNSTPLFEIIHPLITNVSPLLGTWGDVITLTGENFGLTVGSNIVKFGGVTADIINTTATELKVKVPTNLFTTSSSITVQVSTTDNLTAISSSQFLLNAPKIISFDPASGKTNVVITITGQNFNPIAGNNIVKLGDKVAEIISASDNQLIVKFAGGILSGDTKLDVTTGLQKVLSSQFFHVISPWRKISNFPGTPRDQAVAFAASNFGFVGSGVQTSTGAERLHKRFWKYDPVSDVWSEIAYFMYSTGAIEDDYLNMVGMSDGVNGYVGLGGPLGSTNFEKRILKYSVASDVWTEVATSPIPLSATVSYDINGKSYITTGTVSTFFPLPNGSNVPTTVPSRQTFQYDPIANTWTEKALFTPPGKSEATGFSIQSKGYITGGIPVSVIIPNDVWSYDATSNVWTKLKNFPGERRFKASSFAINGFGYLIGGQQNIETTAYLGDIWKYDPTLDSWTRLEDCPFDKRADAVVFVIGDKAYYGTGLSSEKYLNDFYEFDPSQL